MDYEAHVNSPLQLLAAQDPQVAEDLWRFRNPEKGGKKLKFTAILVEIPLRYGFTVSLDTLYRFYRWLGLRRRMLDARDTVQQLREELSKDDGITEEQIDQVAAKVFKAETLGERNVKGYVAVAKLRQGERKLGQNETVLSQNNRKLILMEKKAAAYDQIKKAAANREGGITAEQMEEIERRLKLL